MAIRYPVPVGVDAFRLNDVCYRLLGKNPDFYGDGFVTFASDLTAEELVVFNKLPEKASARATAKAIPNWATWSQSELQTWYDANISATQINSASTLAAMKVISIKQSTAILALAQMLIAFRDYQWPDLQDR
jgi:hypothetical protein